MKRDDVSPPLSAVRSAVSIAIAEDLLPLGDLSAMLVPPEAIGAAAFVARQAGVIAGTDCAKEVCSQIDRGLVWQAATEDGDDIAPGEVIGRVSGPLRALLTAERSALNFLGHLSGVASLTRRYVDEAHSANLTTRIWDTRKTMPGLRALQKAAVRAGGGSNHRGNLSEAILIKDNHLAGIGITDAVHRALLLWPGRMLEVECDRLEQIEEAVQAGATLVLCDNMSPDDVKAAVAIVHGDRRGAARGVLVEASGGIHLDNVAAYAAAGADVISIGALTHSAPNLDIGLDLES